MGESLSFLVLLVPAMISRIVVVNYLGVSSAVVGWAGATITAMGVVLLGLCLFPPLVLDPVMLAIQLPLLGALVGAVAEGLAQGAKWATGRTPRQAAAIRVLVLLTPGAMAVGLQALYSSSVMPPTAAPEALPPD